MISYASYDTYGNAAAVLKIDFVYSQGKKRYLQVQFLM